MHVPRAPPTEQGFLEIWYPAIKRLYVNGRYFDGRMVISIVCVRDVDGWCGLFVETGLICVRCHFVEL